MGARGTPSNTWQDLFWPVVLRAPTQGEFWQKFGTVKRTLGGQMESLRHGYTWIDLYHAWARLMLNLTKSWIWWRYRLYQVYICCRAVAGSLDYFDVIHSSPRWPPCAALEADQTLDTQWFLLAKHNESVKLWLWLRKIMWESKNILMLSLKAKILNIISILSMYPSFIVVGRHHRSVMIFPNPTYSICETQPKTPFWPIRGLCGA